MKSLNEHLAYYDPMRESNERYLPEDQEMENNREAEWPLQNKLGL